MISLRRLGVNKFALLLYGSNKSFSFLHLRRLGVNKFADWTQDEYEALVLPTRGRTPHPTLAAARSARLHAPAVPPAMLPSTVDWRGTPADSPVKDQAACGSCWVRPCPGS